MPTQFVMLSSGTPNYAPSYAQQCSAVIVNNQPYLIDCGDGIMGRIIQARNEKGISAFAMNNLTRLFITHLHPDHTAGLPGLIIGPWVLERDVPLHVYGPKGTQRLVNGILDAYEDGIAEHRDGIVPIADSLRVVVHEISEGEIYRDDNVTVEAFRVSHGGLEAYGLRFVSADKTIVHSGDTCPQQSIIDYAKNCDLLIHEVYMAGSLHFHSAGWQKYHKTVHTSGIELAKMACEIRPKLLILNHQLIWGDKTEADLLAEIAEIYDGEVVSGHDLDIFE